MLHNLSRCVTWIGPRNVVKRKVRITQRGDWPMRSPIDYVVGMVQVPGTNYVLRMARWGLPQFVICLRILE